MMTPNIRRKFTATAWEAKRGSRRSDVLDYIQIGSGFAALTRGIGQTNEEITANARLIEQAPELLECCTLFLCREGEGREADVRGQAFILPDLPWTVKDAAIKALAAIKAPIEARGVTVCEALGKRFIPA